MRRALTGWIGMILATVALAADRYAPTPHLERDVMVAMRDGVRLATDVYRPMRDGRLISEPLPVILHRTPYNKVTGPENDEPPPEDAAFFARHGYVEVFQDYGSEGAFEKYTNEPEDSYVLKMWTHGDYDEYWKQMGVNWVEYYDQTSDIPMIHVSGWYDNYCRSAIDNFVGLSQRKRSPVRLLLGPWTHSGPATTHAGSVEFGPAAAIPDYRREWHLRWYDAFIKGRDNGVAREPAVKLFVMGTGQNLSAHHRHNRHGERVQKGPSHSRRRLEQQFPVLRRELEHGRTARPKPPDGEGRQHHSSCARDALDDHSADRSA
jgi:predicted acyl esterase